MRAKRRVTYRRGPLRFHPPMSYRAAAYIVASSGIVAALYALTLAAARAAPFAG